MEHDGGGIDAGEARDDRHAAVPERKRVAGVEPAVQELADVVQRERVQRVELANAAEVHEGVAGQDVVDRPQRAAEDQPCGADGETDEPHARRHHLTPSDRPRDEDDERSRPTARAKAMVRSSEAPRVNASASPPPTSATDQESAAASGPLPEAARHEPAGQQQHEGRGREPQPEAEAGLGQQARDPEQRRTADHRAKRREVEPFPHRAAFGSARFTPSQATITAPGSAVTSVTRKNRNPVEKA